MATNLTAIISADTAGFVKNVKQARQQLIDWANQAKDQSKDVKKATAEQVNAYIRVLDAMKKTTDGSKDTATATKQLSKEIQELKIQYANLSDEAKSGDFGRSMKQQIEQASAQLNKMNTQISQVSTSMKNVSKGKGGGLSSMAGQIKGLSDIMSDFGVKGAGSISTVMGSMEGLGSTATKLAPLLTNPYTAAAAAIVAVGVALVDYDMKMQASLDKTSKMTGETGESLHQLRAGVQSLADVYGSDYDKQLEATNAIMQQFGLTGQEAVDAISNGLSLGVDNVDGYLDNVKELSGSFADAGVSANDFTNMLTKVNQGLISEDSFKIMQNGFKNISKMESGMVSALSAIGVDANKLQADINSGAITSADAIKQITDAIGQFPPASAEAQNAIRACFEEEGQTAGYAMVTALGDVVTATGDTTDATSDYTNAIRQCQRADEELEQMCDEVFSTGVDWKSLGATIKAGCYTTLSQLVKILGLCKTTIVVVCRTGAAWVRRLTAAINDTVDALSSLLSLDFDSYFAKLKKAGHELYSMGTDYGNIMVEEVEGKGSKSKVNKQIKQQIDTISKQLDREYKENKISKTQYNKYLNDIKSANKYLNQNTVKGDNAAKAILTKVSSGLTSINKKLTPEKQGKPVSFTQKPTKSATMLSSSRTHSTATEDKEIERLRQDENKTVEKAINSFNKYNQLVTTGKLSGDNKVTLKAFFEKYEALGKLYEHVDMPHNLPTWFLDISDLWDMKDPKINQIPYALSKSSLMRSTITPDNPKSIYDKKKSPNELAYEENAEHTAFINEVIEQLDEYSKKLQEAQSDMLDTLAELSIRYNDIQNKGLEPSQADENMRENLIDSLDDVEKKMATIKSIRDQYMKDLGDSFYDRAAVVFKVEKEMQDKQDLEDTIKMYGDLGSAVNSVSSAVNSMGEAFGDANDKTIKTISGVLNALGTMFDTISQLIPVINSITAATNAQTAASTGAAAANQAEAVTAGGKAVANAAATGAKAPWPVAAAMIVTLVGTVISALSGMVSGFAGGGVIGGKTTVGDMNLARVNKGEMILNGRQQAHLFQVLDSGMTGSSVNIAGGSIRVKGSDLYVALKNYSKSSPNAKTL